MDRENIKKNVEQIIVLKGWYSPEKLEELTSLYNPFFDEEFFVWLQQQKTLTLPQIQEIKQLLEDSESGQTLQISQENSSSPTSAAASESFEFAPTSEIPKPIPEESLPQTINISPEETIALSPPKYTDKRAMLDTLPYTLGNYEIIEKIGQGGMGKVYKARHTFLDKFVAFKVLNHLANQNQNYVTRFFREAKAAGALNHPHIIRCLDAGVIDNIYYLAMEYVEGETLTSLMQKKQFTETEVLRIALEIVRALEYASSNGIIHRDLKPENIMLSKTGSVMLLDLGLAKATGDSTLTLEGTLLGTPYYMSPEQCRGEPKITVAADLYSLGASLYHLFTGEVPFRGESPLIIINQHINTPAPSLLHKKPNLNPHINNLVQKLMAKNLSERYRDPKEVEKEILKILEPSSSQKTELSSFVPKQKSRLDSIFPTPKSSTPNPPEKNVEPISALEKTWNQEGALALPPEPSTQKFQFPPQDSLPNKPISTPKTTPLPLSEEDILSKLKAQIPPNSTSLSYSASPEKATPTSLPKNSESFVNPFPNQKKKSPEVEGFIPGNQMYHGNWGTSSSQKTEPSKIKFKRTIAWKKWLRRAILILLISACGYGWVFHENEIRIGLQKGTALFQNLKQKITTLFKSEEIVKIEVTNRPDTLTEEQKATKLRKETIENLLKHQNNTPEQEPQIYAQYQKLLKEYENTPEILLLEPEWDRFYRNYYSNSEQIWSQYEKNDFYDRNLFQFEEALARWKHYLDRFSPLESAQNRGKERMSYFQNLKKSAESKYYTVPYKGFETLWKDNQEFNANWLNTKGLSGGYSVFDSTLKVSLKGKKDLCLLSRKLHTNQYILHFQAQLEKKGFEFLYHYENQTKFNKQIFTPQFPHYAPEKWYLFRLHVRGKDFHWYIFEKDSTEQGQFLLLAEGKQQEVDLKSEQGNFGFFFPTQSVCALETVRILKIEN